MRLLLISLKFVSVWSFVSRVRAVDSLEIYVRGIFSAIERNLGCILYSRCTPTRAYCFPRCHPGWLLAWASHRTHHATLMLIVNFVWNQSARFCKCAYASPPPPTPHTHIRSVSIHTIYILDLVPVFVFVIYVCRCSFFLAMFALFRLCSVLSHFSIFIVCRGSDRSFCLHAPRASWTIIDHFKKCHRPCLPLECVAHFSSDFW